MKLINQYKHHKLVKYLSSGGVMVSTYCYHCNDAASVPTFNTDELQIFNIRN